MSRQPISTGAHSACKAACVSDGGSGGLADRRFPWLALVLGIVGFGALAVMIYFIARILIKSKGKQKGSRKEMLTRREFAENEGT